MRHKVTHSALVVVVGVPVRRVEEEGERPEILV